MSKSKTSRTAQGAGAANGKGKSDILHTVSNFSLYIADSIKMPQNYKEKGELHIGIVEDGIFNPNSDDIYLVAQIKDNIFRAAIGDKTMYCILLSDKRTKLAAQRFVQDEEYEMAVKLRDAKNVFIYMNELNQLLGAFGFRLEDCNFLFNLRVSLDPGTGDSHLDLSGEMQIQIDRFELNTILDNAFELARKGDSDSIKTLITNLTSLNTLSNNILAYLLFLKGFAEEANGHTREAEEIYAEAIKLESSIEQFINQIRAQQPE